MLDRVFMQILDMSKTGSIVILVVLVMLLQLVGNLIVKHNTH